MASLRERCKALAADGSLELFTTTKKYDAAVGREQHHYPPPSATRVKQHADRYRPDLSDLPEPTAPLADLAAQVVNSRRCCC